MIFLYFDIILLHALKASYKNITGELLIKNNKVSICVYDYKRGREEKVFVCFRKY